MTVSGLPMGSQYRQIKTSLPVLDTHRRPEMHFGQLGMIKTTLETLKQLVLEKKNVLNFIFKLKLTARLKTLILLRCTPKNGNGNLRKTVETLNWRSWLQKKIMENMKRMMVDLPT